MPYILASQISKSASGLWGEGNPYSTDNIYDFCSHDPVSPPVHYDSHLLKPHSICHFDAPAHVIHGGDTIDQIFEKNPKIFFGWAEVVNLGKPKFKPHGKILQMQHWEVSLEELQKACDGLQSLQKIVLSFENISSDFYVSRDRALTLSVEAAQWLSSSPGFNLLGTPWRSVDFQPGSSERPIHKEIFKNGGILECLNLEGIPAGRYFLSAFPIPLKDASESPVCPVLYTQQELIE